MGQWGDGGDPGLDRMCRRRWREDSEMMTRLWCGKWMTVYCQAKVFEESQCRNSIQLYMGDVLLRLSKRRMAARITQEVDVPSCRGAYVPFLWLLGAISEHVQAGQNYVPRVVHNLIVIRTTAADKSLCSKKISMFIF